MLIGFHSIAAFPNCYTAIPSKLQLSRHRSNMNLHTQQLQQIPKFYWHLSKLALQVQKEKSSQILSQSMKRSGLPTGLAQAIERDSTLETDPSYLGHHLKVSLEETLKLSLSFLISRVLILKHLAHKIQFTSVTQSCLLFATP